MEQGDGSGARMGTDGGREVIDDDLLNAEALLDLCRDILRILDAVSVCDHDRIVILACDMSAPIADTGIQRLLAAADIAYGNEFAGFVNVKHGLNIDQRTEYLNGL